MKYLLILLLMSGYVSADIENEIKLASALEESNQVIERLMYRVELLTGQNERLKEEQVRTFNHLVNVTNNCMTGLDFVSIDKAGRTYRFHCQEAFD